MKNVNLESEYLKRVAEIREELRANTPEGCGRSFILIATDENGVLVQGVEGNTKGVVAMTTNLLTTTSLFHPMAKSLEYVLGAACMHREALEAQKETPEQTEEADAPETEADDEYGCQHGN